MRTHPTPLEAALAEACILLTCAQDARRAVRGQLSHVQHHGTREDQPAGEAINAYLLELGAVVDQLDDGLTALDRALACEQAETGTAGLPARVAAACAAAAALEAVRPMRVVES